MDKEYFKRLAEQTRLENQAARARAEAVAKTLYDHCGVEPGPRLGEEFLRHAWRRPSVDAFFLAISMGLSARDCLVDTAMRWGMETTPEPGTGQEECLRSLVVEAGAPGVLLPPIKQINLHSMMDILAMFGDVGALGLALAVVGDEGARVAREPGGDEGRSPLSRAAGEGHPGAYACCELLLGWGADPNLGRGCDASQTPLYFACKARNLEVCRLLARHGADAGRIDGKLAVARHADVDCKAAIQAGLDQRALDEVGHREGVAQKKRATL